MAHYFPAPLDPDETALYVVDWTDEMDAASDTLTGTPTFVFDDASVYGLQITSIALASGNKKVNCFISNTDPATNRSDVIANSPYPITHVVTTTNGQTLTRHLTLVVAEKGSNLIVTASGAASNSYGTLAEADAYMADMGYTWAGTDHARVQKLIRGCRALDARFVGKLKGSKTTSGQALQFPRINLTDEDANVVASDTIPAAVKRAQFEMSLVVDAEQKMTSPQQIRAAGAGSARVEFSSSFEVRARINHVIELMRPYVQSSNRLVRA